MSIFKIDEIITSTSLATRRLPINENITPLNLNIRSHEESNQDYRLEVDHARFLSCISVIYLFFLFLDQLACFLMLTSLATQTPSW